MNYINALRIIVVSLVILGVAGCQYIPRLDEVIPDRRTEYRQSRAMPDLEIPPDLTADRVGGGLAIPGEEELTTLSAFEQQQRRAAGGAAAYTGPDEQWVSVRGDRFEVWPRLREFWLERGYALDLDDTELGVLETGWSDPRSTAEGEVRDKFKVFAEPGDEPGSTLLFISHIMQRQSQLGGGETQWVDADGSIDSERQVAADMSGFFGGTAPGTIADPGMATAVAGAEPRSSAIPRARIVNNEKGQVYLSLPNEYTQAWQLTERALIRSGLDIRSKDAEQGEYFVLYSPPEGEDDGGWLSRLAFWRGGEKERAYRISLTGAGDHTELTVLDKDGVWQSDDEARTILSMIQRQYEQLIS